MQALVILGSISMIAICAIVALMLNNHLFPGHSKKPMLEQVEEAQWASRRARWDANAEHEAAIARADYALANLDRD